MRTRCLCLFLVLAPFILGGLTSTAVADPSSVVSIQLPAETAVYRQGPGQELAQSLCITCHSADYAEMQPPMPKKFWEATMKKMREKFGAPVNEELSAKLADYFVAAYGVPDKK